MALHQFLLIYNVATQRLIRANDLGDNTTGAVSEYAECERRYRGNKDIEVVLIGSDSLETIKKTHGHYFGEVDPSEFFRTVKV
jgi:hypothetical protein